MPNSMLSLSHNTPYGRIQTENAFMSVSFCSPGETRKTSYSLSLFFFFYIDLIAPTSARGLFPVSIIIIRPESPG